MKHLKIILLPFVLLAASFNAYADSGRSFGDIYKECGLGAMIFPDDPLAAIFTNVTSDLGSTA
jgi:hypothetical protein